MERKTWKTINYIGENQRLKVLSAGATQISSSQILIFGGFIPSEPNTEDSEEKKNATPLDVQDNGVDLTLTGKTMVLDVTVGSIKYGSDLQTPSYFPSGGYMMPH